MPTPAARTPDHPEWLVNRSELAGLLGVGERTVTRLTHKGMPQRVAGRWHLGDVIKWLLGPSEGPPGTEPGYQEVRRQLALAQTRKVDAETARLQNQVIPYTEVVHLQTAVVQVLLSGLDALAPRCGTRLASLTTPPECEDAIDDEVRRIRAELAQQLRQLETGYQPASEPDGPAPAKARRAMGGRTSKVAPRKSRARSVA